MTIKTTKAEAFNELSLAAQDQHFRNLRRGVSSEPLLKNINNQLDKITLAAVDSKFNEARQVIEFELAEEISDGRYTPDQIEAIAFLKSLELIEVERSMLSAIHVQLLGRIDRQAIYAKAGYNSAREWFAAEASFKRGGQAHDYQWIADTLIPYCKSNKIFPSAKVADKWFRNHKNLDGSSRVRQIRIAIPELRRVIGDEYGLDPEEKNELVQLICGMIQDPAIKAGKLREHLNTVREAKPVIQVYKNGNGKWHVVEFEMTDRQLNRFQDQNGHSTIIDIVTADNRSPLVALEREVLAHLAALKENAELDHVKKS